MSYSLLEKGPAKVSVQGEPIRKNPKNMMSPAVYPTPYRHVNNDSIPEGKASLCSTMLNLTNTITGAGMLGLPYAFANSGVAMGLLWFMLTGFGESYAIHLLAKCILKERKYSFRALVNKTLQFKGKENFINGVLAFNCFGYCCGYVIVCGQLFPDIVKEFFKVKSSSILINPKFWISIMVWVIAFPLVCLRSLDNLKFTSAIGFVGILYVAIISILYAFGGEFMGDACAGHNEPCPGDFYWWYAGSASDLLRVISVFCYAFVCTQNVPTLTFELKNNTVRRLDLAANGAIMFAIGIYFLTALSGYIIFGNVVDPDMLVSFPRNTYISVARLMIGLVLCSTFPIQMFPTKNAVCNIIFGVDAIECKNYQYYGTIFLLMASAWAVGIFIKDLSIVLAFIGGSTSIFIGYTLPAFLYIRLFSEEGFTFDKIMSFIILFVSMILSPLLIAVEIYSLTR